MSPYIVETRRPCGDPECCGPVVAPSHVVVSRRAVATLEEDPQSNVKDEVARVMLRAGVVQQSQFWARAILGLTESGGTVGPLADGTVIEVEPTMWADLLAEFAVVVNIRQEAVIAAFNARESGPGA